MARQLFLFILLQFGIQILCGQERQNISSHICIYQINRVSEQQLPFKGEGNIFDGVPVFRFRVAVPESTNPSSVNLALKNLSWVPYNDPFITEYPQEFKKAEYHLVNIRKETYLEIELVPFAVISDIPQQLESFDFEISFDKQFSSILKSSSISEKYASNSVLASSKWWKISVTETGIHKIPYSSLTNWGFASPENVRVFGYGGEMLPKLNSDSRPDDLPEVAIWHYNNAIYFYALGPVIWKWNSEENMFLHQIHDYSNEAYYFLSDISGSVKSPQIQPSETGENNYTSTHFDDLRFHEQELNNLLRSGRRWFGEKFSPSGTLSRDYNFIFPSRDVSQPVKISTRVACRDNTESIFEYKVNDQEIPILSLNVPAISFSDYVGYYAYENKDAATFTDNNSNINISVTLLNSASTVSGWLDYISINTRSNLQITDSQLSFRDKASHGDGNITLFKITNASEETTIWDVTNRNDAQKLTTTRNGSTLQFKTSTSLLKEFVAFNPSGQFPIPVSVGAVENQNLHATGQVDYIIIVPREFTTQANQLAELHNNHNALSTLVVNPEAIYNEFSWGHKDPTAIRSFVKMLYDKAEGDLSKTPKYLLLFGNGSFDNRSSDGITKSHIITYQSENSIHRTNTYVTDDYYGFLDETEGDNDQYNRSDIGIGRFPVKNVTEAQTSVDKVKAYLEEQSTGKWSKLITFIGDDEDSNNHMTDANLLANKVENNYPQFDIRKIFLDNYEKVTTSTGKRFPDATDIVNRTINEGTLIFNYVGHGSENVLSTEQIVNIPGIKNWNNIRNLPVFVTATCEFSRFDNPYLVSAGEEVFLNPTGGAIALLSTTRIVYASLNYELNDAFFNYVFLHNPNGEKPALGDVVRLTKASSGNTINKLNFTLLGDPAIKLQYPENRINLVKINNKLIEDKPDTLKALSRIQLEAEIVTPDGISFDTFNGLADITVYDKAMNLKTLGNDGATPFEFSQYSNIIFKGKSTVTNGKFSSEFIIPYDIRYNFAPGRISLYAYSEESGEAFGANNEIIVGGFNLSAPDDNDGPNVKLYLNHDSFKPGDKTGKAPLLYAQIKDESGINTSGSGIGHDITLVIDGKKENPIILNSYFEAKNDTYQEGLVLYQLPELSKGSHQISLKVWDTYNNSTTTGTDFAVVDNNELTIKNFMFYPNPVALGDNFYFYFNMDEPNSTLVINTESINTSGSLIGKAKVQIVASGNDIDPIPLSLWTLGIKNPGIYFIRFLISSSTGRETQVVQKIMVRP